MKRIVNTKPQAVVYGRVTNNITYCMLGVYPPPLTFVKKTTKKTLSFTANARHCAAFGVYLASRGEGGIFVNK